MIGKQLGNITIVEKAWKCKCNVCGDELYLNSTLDFPILCSCIDNENTRKVLLGRWKGIKKRCYQKSHSDYVHYGGRGISICDEWKNNFDMFYDWSIRNGFRKELTLERKNVNGNYEPSNCEWITKQKQNANRRNKVTAEINGEIYTVKELSELTGLSENTIYIRIKRRGWKGEKLLLGKQVN